MDAIKHPKTLPKMFSLSSYFSLFKASLNLQVTGNEGVKRSGAGEGNRTLVSSLGSLRSTIELHPQVKEANCPHDESVWQRFIYDHPACG